jgi:hypothetical protein
MSLSRDSDGIVLSSSTDEWAEYTARIAAVKCVLRLLYRYQYGRGDTGITWTSAVIAEQTGLSIEAVSVAVVFLLDLGALTETWTGLELTDLGAGMVRE